jgi:hypothetical protein
VPHEHVIVGGGILLQIEAKAVNERSYEQTGLNRFDQFLAPDAVSASPSNFEKYDYGENITRYCGVGLH